MEEKMEQKISHIKPRLKTGTIIYSHQDRTYIGTLRAGIEVNSPIRAVLESMNGKQNCAEISNSLGYPLPEIEELVRTLEAAHLIDTEVGKISFHSRFHSRNAHRTTHAGDDSQDGAYQQLQIKMAPELSFTTWLTGVRDGGVGRISDRRKVEINIYGSSRIASLLFGILLSSGISQTHLHIKAGRAIGEDDICAGYLRSSDIGLSLASRTRELARDLALFPDGLAKKGGPISLSQSSERSANSQIAIVIGSAPADLLQKWMSEGTPHLLIEDPDAASITIGPLVIPGRTPCARCISLARADQGELWNDLAWQKSIASPLEVPVSVAHHIAGLIALELLSYVDSQKCSLPGVRLRFNYHTPTQSERTFYARHPVCGCSWTGESAANF